MNPIFFSSSSNNYSPYQTDHCEDHLQTHQFFDTSTRPSSSSSSIKTHMFLSSNDQNELFNTELQSPQYQHEGDNFGAQPFKNHGVNDMSVDLHQVKWMSSKMRVMLKMKKSYQPMNQNAYSSTTSRDVLKIEEKTDNSSNSTCSNNDVSIRVCSDCNTTKTPLWRSGPQGPKSLCNACGIRQRKARRAAAAAAAADNGNVYVYNDKPVIMPLKVIKTQHKVHKKPSYKGHATKYKKRQYSKQITTTPLPSPSPSPSPLSSPSSSSPSRKINCVEDFLTSLSKNLTHYHVLPQDEKEAAILLMAISCGCAHEP